MNNRYRIYRNYPFLFLFLTFPSLQSFGICFDPTNLNSNLNIRYYAERIFFFLFFYSFSPFTFGKSNFHFLLSRVGDRGVPKPCWNPAAGERITDTFRPEKKGKKDTPGLWRQKSKKKKKMTRHERFDTHTPRMREVHRNRGIIWYRVMVAVYLQ